MTHRTVSTENQWERKYGYARAVRAGNTVVCTGTVSVDRDGTPHGINDPYAQAQRIYEIIERAFAELGAVKTDIVRTRMFVTDIAHSDSFGRAHRDFFASHTPCLTMIEISRLIDGAFLIEIEAEAIVAG